jgi:hypothetical protein
MDGSEEFAHASDSIRVNREFDLNVTSLSDPHSEKHSERKISTFRGIKID